MEYEYAVWKMATILSRLTLHQRNEDAVVSVVTKSTRLYRVSPLHHTVFKHAIAIDVTRFPDIPTQ